MTYKQKILTPALLLIVAASSQDALAVSAFNSNAILTYTVTVSNQNALGNFDNLDASEEEINGDGEETGFGSPVFYDDPSSTSQSNQAINFYLDSGVSYTQTFQAEDSIMGGTADSDYGWYYNLSFTNESSNANDIYDITVAYSYVLTSTVSGQYADSEVFFTSSNYNEDEGVDVNSNASTDPENLLAPLTGSGSFAFSLLNDESEHLYFDVDIISSLEASPVPAPAALWLFSTALLAFPGLKRYKSHS